MPDIMKFIRTGDTGEDPAEAPEDESGALDENAVRERAGREGLELTDAHWEVLDFLHRYYGEHGTPEYARHLSDALETAFADKGGRRYLYRLFPNGPIYQGARIAGLPIPDGTVDRSFGTVR